MRCISYLSDLWCVSGNFLLPNGRMRVGSRQDHGTPPMSNAICHVNMPIRFAQYRCFSVAFRPYWSSHRSSRAPAIFPIPSKLGVPLTSVVFLLRVARAASGTRKSPSFDGFGHLVSRGKLYEGHPRLFHFMDSVNSPAGRPRYAQKNHQIPHSVFIGIGDPISISVDDHQAISLGRADHSVTTICQSASIGYKFYHRCVCVLVFSTITRSR
ncbi:hypothetical protein F5888DRAFT_506399 [Russula emetica]|nr:hypothetical protein F5888DRAFT_506399 [Russula emetica]